MDPYIIGLERFTFLLLKLFQLLKLYTAERGRKIITNGGKAKVSNNAKVAYSIIYIYIYIFFFSRFVRREKSNQENRPIGPSFELATCCM